MVDTDPATSLLTNNGSSVLNYGMKRDFNAWLATLGESAPVKTLTELREWNLAHASAGAIKYGQTRLDGSDEIDLEDKNPDEMHDTLWAIVKSRYEEKEQAVDAEIGDAPS